MSPALTPKDPTGSKPDPAQPEWATAPSKPFIKYDPTATPTPDPKRLALPGGRTFLMYSREQLVILYRCSHGELGRLLKIKLAPLPIRVDGNILWYVDEALASQALVERTLGRWRKR